jgi:thioredoxin-related protein
VRLRDYMIDGLLWLLFGLACGVLSAGEHSDVEVIYPDVVVIAEPEVKAPNDKPYFIMFSSTYCGPCQRWKASELKKLNAAGYQVTIINVDEDDRWNAKYNVTTVPRFFLLDRKTRRTLKGPWVGFTPAVTLIVNANGKNLLAPADHSRKTARLTCPEIRALVRSRYSPGHSLNADVSPQSMVWGHLTDGSGGTHTFTRDQVSCLSLWEALALHDDAHGARTIRP